MSNSFNIQQYQRQIILPGIGNEGQQKLHDAKVLVIGAGGLGCPALQYLVAAGIGNIGIIDGDTVDRSNLHRQILYDVADVGKSKAMVAAEKLRKQNPACSVEIFDCFLDKFNVFDIIENFDIIIDGSDNFSTRYLVNDACVLMQKTLVYGAIYRFEGQVAVFNAVIDGSKRSAQYRDLFPEPPSNIQNCAEAGVLGVLPGIIGCMQATEVIKLITDIGKPLINRLLSYNALSNESILLEISATDQGANSLPKSKEAFLAFNYNIDQCITNNNLEVESDRLNNMIADGYVAVDVREINEKPNTNAFSYLKMPLSNFNAEKLSAERILLFCQSGARSKMAAAELLEKFPNKKVYSLKGGIIAWLNNFEQHGT